MTTRMHRFVSAFALTVSLFAQFVSSAQDQPPLHQAELVRVIDGDTVVLDLHLGLDIWKRKLHCRLVGIDAPELRPRRLPKNATPAQRKARADGIRRARKAKAALQQLLIGDCATGACFQSVPANQVFAAPDGAAGQAAFRALVDADLPSTNALDSELHAQSHVLATTAGLGADHTTSGLTAGQVLRATAAGAAAFQSIQDGDLPASIARDSELHAQSHVLDGADHTVSGLTIGNYLRALTASTFGFSVILDGDLPASIARDSELHAQSHVLAGSDHTASGLTIGNVIRATSATAFAWQQLGFSDLGGSATDAQIPDTISIANLTQVATRNHSDLQSIAAGVIGTCSLRGNDEISPAGTGTGDPADIVAADETVLGRTAAGNLVFAQVATGQVANNAITDALLRDSAATSIIGRSAGTTGDPADIAASLDGQVLRRAAGALGFGSLDLADTDAVTGLLPDANIAASISRDTEAPGAGDIGGSLSAGYTINAGAVASAELATANKTFKCNFTLVRDTGLKDSDDGDTVSNCSRPGRAITITEVIAETDAGSPVINLQRDDGTPANLLSSNCTATTGGATCTIALTEDNFAATDKLDFVAVSGMSGANRVSILIEYTVD